MKKLIRENEIVITNDREELLKRREINGAKRRETFLNDFSEEREEIIEDGEGCTYETIEELEKLKNSYYQSQILK